MQQIQYIDVILEDTDIAKSLTEYVNYTAIENLVLGAGKDPAILAQSREFLKNFASRADTIFSGVFDGHGPYGHMVAKREELEEKLVVAREESAKLTDCLNDVFEATEILKRDKEEILAKLSEAERLVGDSKSRVNKVEEDNAKLRRALEQSMTRLNRMSMDSDYFVDSFGL
ncbi:hypothetical protein AgCh_029653 [Apium graveolens]